ncbi:MAG: hypothetical protein ACI9IA_002019, partial [Enterobacterales bacterium]
MTLLGSIKNLSLYSKLLFSVFIIAAVTFSFTLYADQQTNADEV